MAPIGTKRSVGWMGLKRGHRAKPLEWLAEKIIFLISLTAILMVFLIFIFIGREALPVIFGRMDTAQLQKVLPAEQVKRLKPAELRDYLGVTREEFARMDQEAIQTLIDLKADSVKERPADKDAAVNTAEWRYLLGPHQWTGYPGPAYIWQPVSQIPKFNILPL